MLVVKLVLVFSAAKYQLGDLRGID